MGGLRVSFLAVSTLHVVASAAQAKLKHRAVNDHIAVEFSPGGAIESLVAPERQDTESHQPSSEHAALVGGVQSTSNCGDIRVFDSKQKSGLNVTIASMFIGENEQSWSAVKDNHVAYAKKHGLNYFAPDCAHTFTYGHFDRRSRLPTWSKMAIAEFLFDSNSDAVFWMDADSLFMDDSRDLRYFLRTGEDFVFAGDCGVLFNAGHFLLRNTDWSKWFLREAYAICPAPNWDDNGAMLAVLGGGAARDPAGWGRAVERVMARCVTAEDAALCAERVAPGLRGHVRALPQRDMNTYTHSECSGAAATSVNALRNSSQVPFIVHMAGRPPWSKKHELPLLASLAHSATQSPTSLLAEGRAFPPQTC